MWTYGWGNQTMRTTLQALLLLLLVSWSQTWGYTRWTMLAPGLAYTTLFPLQEERIHQIHVFRLDLKHFQLQLAFARDFAAIASHAAEFAQRKQALLAVNGGFFTPDFKPIGLRIQNGVVLNPVKNTSWFGIFLINNNQPKIIAKDDYMFSDTISFAIQAGPRILINKTIPQLKEGEYERTVLAINNQGQVLIITTQNSPISLRDLATLIRKEEEDDGLNVVNALNLDGGSSSQLFAAMGDFQLNVLSLSAVSDAVVVVAHPTSSLSPASEGRVAAVSANNLSKKRGS